MKAQQQNQNQTQTQAQQNQPNQPSSSNLDKDKLVNYMDKHANSSSQGKCAMACRKGFEAGGLDTTGHPVDAKDYVRIPVISISVPEGKRSAFLRDSDQGSERSDAGEMIV